MAVNYKAYEFQCYEQIRRMEALLDFGGGGEELRPWQCDARKLREALETRHFRVAVVGEFNRGKTSFINALLGKEILPADGLPTTAAINRITYDDTPSSYILLKNGQRQDVNIEELADYITKLTASAQANASQIEEAVVRYPSLFCRNGVDLLDTPGMNDEHSMNQVTLSRLEDVDLAIIAVNASMPFSMTERDFTAQLLESPQICQIVIAITKIDTIRPKERQKLVDFMTARIQQDVGEYLARAHESDDAIMQKYHAIFDHPRVFAVSSLDALDALARNDMELFAESGFLRLNDELPQLIMTSQNSNIIMTSLRKLQDIIRPYRRWLIQRREERKKQEPVLQAASDNFSQIALASAKRAYKLSEKDCIALFSLDLNRLHSQARKRFIQALSQMRTLSHEELQRVLFPAMKDAFQSLNDEVAVKDRDSLTGFQNNVLNKLGHETSQMLEALLVPFPPLWQAIRADISALPDAFSLARDAIDESFFWVRSPIPDQRSLGPDWNVMPFVDAVIRSSLQNYQTRREKGLTQLLTESENQLDSRLRQLFATFHSLMERYSKQLNCGREEQETLDGLQRLEQSCQALQMRFQEELRRDMMGRMDTNLTGKMTSRRFTVGMMGEFGRGKSSVVNALLGETVLPPDIFRFRTVVPVRITYGAKSCVKLRMYDGSVREIGAEEMLDYLDYVTRMPKTYGGCTNDVDEIVMYSPCRLCKNGLDIVDTLGMMGVDSDDRSGQLWKRISPKLDAFIMVLQYDAPFSISEAEFVRNKLMPNDLGRIIFLVNKMNAIRRPEDKRHIVDAIKKRIQTTVLGKIADVYGKDSKQYQNARTELENIRIFPFSALDALEGKQAGDEAMIERSGVKDLEDTLTKMLLKEP